MSKRLGIGPHSKVGKLELPKARCIYPLYEYKKPIIAGFGYDRIEVRIHGSKRIRLPTGTLNTLRYAETAVIPNKVYLSQYIDTVYYSHLIAKINQSDGPKGICKVIFRNREKDFLISAYNFLQSKWSIINVVEICVI